MNGLTHGHGERLVHRQEGHINVLQISHLRDVFGITSHIDTQTVDGEDVPIAIALWVKAHVVWGGVIGRNALQQDVTTEVSALEVLYDVTPFQLALCSPIED